MDDQDRGRWWSSIKFSARDVVSLAVILVSIAGAFFTLRADIKSVERDRMRDRYDYRSTIKEMKEDNLRTVARIEKQVQRIEDRLLTWPRAAP